MGKAENACILGPVVKGVGQLPRSPDLRFSEALNATFTIVKDRDARTPLRYVARRIDPTQALVEAHLSVVATEVVTAQRLLAAAAARSQSPTKPVVAVSIEWEHTRIWSTDRLPPAYGHIWGIMYAFWQSFVLPRMEAVQHAETVGRKLPPWATVVLPAGTHIGGTHGSRAFEELVQLWSTNATRLTIERAPWVPICMQKCCWAVGSPPPTPRTLLLSRFPFYTIDFARWPHFRRDAWRSLGVLPAQTATKLVLWTVAAAGSNSRKLKREGEIYRAVSEVLSEERPGWTIEQLRANSEKIPYTDELRRIASASVLISLFGSAIHVSVPMSFPVGSPLAD